MPNSLTGSIIRAAPADMSPTSVMGALFNQVVRLPASVVSAFSPKTRAATINDMSAVTGVQWFGALPADLAQDTAPEVRQQQAADLKCPETDPNKEFNVCQADSTVIKGLTCIYEDCPEFVGN
jgi:hypothetical protein